jgi:excinuclease ABC subunit B
MTRAIGETERRREKQLAFNAAHGITPQTIRKNVADVMEGARLPAPGAARDSRRRGGTTRKAPQRIELPTDPKALGKLIEKLEAQMLDHARNLEFEEAAMVRDQLKEIRAERLLA